MAVGDPIRNDPRFEKLAASPALKATDKQGEVSARKRRSHSDGVRLNSTFGLSSTDAPKARDSVPRNFWNRVVGARIRPKPERAMQAVPLGRLAPGKSETPPCKSGQLEKDLGLEVSSARHAARLIIFEFMRSFFVGPSAPVVHLLDL
jgi:hypothetical protein